jgi:type I restriction enzyme S subunit
MSATAQMQKQQIASAAADRDLPEGWADASLEGCTALITKGSTPTSYGFKYKSSGISFVRVENLSNGYIDGSSITTFIDNDADEALKRSRLEAGDLLFSIAGTIGRTALVKPADLPANTNQALAIIRGTDRFFSPQFLRFALASTVAQQQAEAGARGGGMNNISLEDVRSFRLPVPPAAEQRRIVAKVEELFAQIDASRGRLAKVTAILKRLRQSVLAAACSGPLTEDWRREKGINSDEWTQATLDKVADMRLGKMLDKSKNVGTPTPYLRNLNVRWFSFDLSDVALMRATPDEQDELAVRDGDLLVCEGGEPGRCAVWNLGPTGIVFQKAIHRIRLGKDISPDWLAFNLKNDAESGILEDYFTGSTIKHLTGRSLATYSFRRPPIQEQQEIVRRVEALFKLANAIQKRVEAVTKRADKLTQAILAKAFRGQLVPTEAELARREGRDYEPASSLLERIWAEWVPNPQREITRMRTGFEPGKQRSKGGHVT